VKILKCNFFLPAKNHPKNKEISFHISIFHISIFLSGGQPDRNIAHYVVATNKLSRILNKRSKNTNHVVATH